MQAQASRGVQATPAAVARRFKAQHTHHQHALTCQHSGGKGAEVAVARHRQHSRARAVRLRVPHTRAAKRRARGLLPPLRVGGGGGAGGSPHGQPHHGCMDARCAAVDQQPRVLRAKGLSGARTLKAVTKRLGSNQAMRGSRLRRYSQVHTALEASPVQAHQQDSSMHVKGDLPPHLRRQALRLLDGATGAGQEVQACGSRGGWATHRAPHKWAL